LPKRKKESQSPPQAQLVQESQEPIVDIQSLERLPTERQQKTFENFVARGCDIKQLGKAAEDAGYPKKYAWFLGFRAIKAHKDNPYVLMALEKYGVSIDRIIKTISDKMDAKHPNPHYGYKKDGKWQRADDSMAQLKAIQMAIKLIDIEPSKKLDISGEFSSHQDIHITIEDISRIERTEAIIEGEVLDADE